MSHSPFSSLPESLVREIREQSVRKRFEEGQEILREGQFVSAIPVVLEGLVKVYTRYEERELLLYYIEPEESCIMSFSAGMGQEPSQIYAQTEAPSELLLLPVEGVRRWMREFPVLNGLFFQQYRQRYSELLETIHHVLFNKLHVRLYEHLKRKASLRDTSELFVSHQQLADELGTVREVITRTVKKLEAEGLVRQNGQRIEILKSD